MTTAYIPTYTQDAARRLAPAMGLGLAFGAYMALADATIFREVIPTAQYLSAHSSALARIAVLAPMAALDELIWRSGLLAALCYVLRGRGRGWAVLAVAVLYMLGHPGYLMTVDSGVLAWVREAALHVGAGVLWGYIYLRYGLAAAMLAHMSAHVTLQPLLTVLL